MLDIRLIRENPGDVERRLALRGRDDGKIIAAILKQDEERRALLQRVESLKAERNRASKEVGALKAQKKPADEILARMKSVSDEIAALDAQVTRLESEQQQTVMALPNLPHASVPEGADASSNRIERVVGIKPEFSFKPKAHWDIGAQRGILDLERAAKLSGTGFIVFRGIGARLERSLYNFMLDIHTREHGYTEIAPPFVVRGACMVGTGQLPHFVADMYAVQDEDLFLVPTAEVPVTNLHREEILKEDDLPLRYVAYTPCFRREAGSGGKDTRGIIRVHQFDKVELVQIAHPDQSYARLEELTSHAEKILQLLGLHYRVVSLCTGDLGFGAAKCYDLEVWAPGLESWLEVSSCSNFESYQARRMQLRFKDGTGKNQLCHTLNGSGTALARLFIALVETYQQADGSVRIPEPLQPYLGVSCI